MPFIRYLICFNVENKQEMTYDFYFSNQLQTYNILLYFVITVSIIHKAFLRHTKIILYFNVISVIYK